jgi:hypothetical protein
VAFKIRSASAFKFKIDGLNAARSGLGGLIEAAYSVVQGSSSWRYESAKKSLILTEQG